MEPEPCSLAPRPSEKDLARSGILAWKRRLLGGIFPPALLPWLTLRAWRSCDQARAGTSLHGRCCKLLGAWMLSSALVSELGALS